MDYRYPPYYSGDDPEEEEAWYLNNLVQAALKLDELYPGWENQIDLDQLDMMDPSCCILGQLYGDWEQGQHALVDEGFPWVGGIFSTYKEQWTNEIQRRREVPALVPA